MVRSRRRKPRYLQNEEESQRIPVNPQALAPHNSWSLPDFYVDQRFRCVDCGAEEIWTAAQQQWWHEVAKGFIWSTAIRCRVCRIKLRERHAGTPRRSHEELQRDVPNPKEDEPGQ